jgi:hypothetical protein
VKFIGDPDSRTTHAKKLIKEMEELTLRLSVECDYETVVVCQPITDAGNAIYLCGLKSMMATKKLMDTNVAKDIIHLSQTQWNFDSIPTSDLFTHYRVLFHCLVRECT